MLGSRQPSESEGGQKKPRLKPLLILNAAFLGVALVGAIDYVTGPEIAASVFYVLPVALAAWLGSSPAAVLVSFTAAAVWLMIDHASGSTYSHPFIPFWNAGVRLTFFLIVTFLLARVRFLRDNLDALVRARTTALDAEITRRKEIQSCVTQISNQEQERLARELHDNIGAYLSGLGFRAKTLAEKLKTAKHPQANEALELTDVVAAAGRQVRYLARFLAPVEAMGEHFDLSLEHLCREMHLLFGVECTFIGSRNLPRLSSEQARHLYRIAQEATRNAAQHGKATSVEIELRSGDNSLTLIIRNNGLPFRPKGGADRTLGLRIMRYRAEAMGGTLVITTQPDRKTAVICATPLAKPEELGKAARV